jgi:hypothetical protein
MLFPFENEEWGPNCPYRAVFLIDPFTELPPPSSWKWVDPIADEPHIQQMYEEKNSRPSCVPDEEEEGNFSPMVCMRSGRKVNLFVCIPLTEKEVQLKRKGGGTGMVPYLESGALPLVCSNQRPDCMDVEIESSESSEEESDES